MRHPTSTSKRTVTDRLEGPLAGFDHLLLWAVRLVWLNFWWTLLTVLGGIVLGVGPATVAAHTVATAWVRGNTDVSISHEMWSTWRRCWWPATRAILLAAVLFLALATTWYSSRSQAAIPAAIVQGLALAGVLALAVITTHLPWVIARHSEQRVAHHFTAALAVGVGRPLLTMVLLVLVIGWPVLLAVSGWPGLLPVCGVSVPLTAGAWCIHKTLGHRRDADDDLQLSDAHPQEPAPAGSHPERIR